MLPCVDQETNLFQDVDNLNNVSKDSSFTRDSILSKEARVYLPSCLHRSPIRLNSRYGSFKTLLFYKQYFFY